MPQFLVTVGSFGMYLVANANHCRWLKYDEVVWMSTFTSGTSWAWDATDRFPVRTLRAARCRELETPTSKRSSLKPWRPSHSPTFAHLSFFVGRHISPSFLDPTILFPWVAHGIPAGGPQSPRFGFTNDPDGYLLLKVSQLIELLEIRHSVFLMGNPGSVLAAVVVYRGALILLDVEE